MNINSLTVKHAPATKLADSISSSRTNFATNGLSKWMTTNQQATQSSMFATGTITLQIAACSNEHRIRYSLHLECEGQILSQSAQGTATTDINHPHYIMEEITQKPLTQNIAEIQAALEALACIKILRDILKIVLPKTIVLILRGHLCSGHTE